MDRFSIYGVIILNLVSCHLLRMYLTFEITCSFYNICHCWFNINGFMSLVSDRFVSIKFTFEIGNEAQPPFLNVLVSTLRCFKKTKVS